MSPEVALKWDRIRSFLKESGLRSVVISRVSNFAWFTGGRRNFVALHAENGAASVLVTPRKLYLAASNIEMARLQQEEMWEIPHETILVPWYQDAQIRDVVRKVAGDPAGSDAGWPGFAPVSLEGLHVPLTSEEIARYRCLGAGISAAFTQVCRSVRPGQTEQEVAGELSRRLWGEGITPVVLLVAADERIASFRHPLPGPRPIRRIVMVAGCGRRNGLICSVTRMVHFGPVPEPLRRKHRAVCAVDACFISETVPGAEVRTLFSRAVQSYRDAGFWDEWTFHHQGGPTGYLPRYYRACQTREESVLENQAFAWNPSISGTKSEDTLLATASGPDIFTADPSWPMLEVEYGGKTVLRPDILVL